MPAQTSTRRRAVATVAALQRHGADDERIAAARRDLRAAELEEHVRRIVDAWPPLTGEQCDKIASLLRPSIDEAAKAG